MDSPARNATNGGEGAPEPIGSAPFDPVVNVAGIDEDAIADGPGLRFVLFVQGCARNCPGCHNPQTHAFGAGTDMHVSELFQRIVSNPLLTGVTFSGGDPMYQAAPLAELAERLRAHGGYDITVFTGDTFEGLLRRGTPDQLRLLKAADILIDGPFIREQRDRLLRFRGSANQRILDVRRSLSELRPVWTIDPEWIEGDPIADPSHARHAGT